MKIKESKEESLFRQAISGLKSHRWGWLSLWILLSLMLATIFAGFLSPYDPFEQNRAKSYHPPVSIHIMDEEGIHTPFIYNYKMVDPIFKVYEPDITKRYPLRFFVKGTTYRL